MVACDYYNLVASITKNCDGNQQQNIRAFDSWSLVSDQPLNVPFWPKQKKEWLHKQTFSRRWMKNMIQKTRGPPFAIKCGCVTAFGRESGGL